MRVFTSRHLFLLASNYILVILQADATYKLLRLGFHVFIIGISDMNKGLHRIAMHYVKKKKQLILLSYSTA